MGVNIDEILASLEQEKPAEANFAEGLSNDSTPESTEENNTEAVSEDNAPADTPEESTKEASAEETEETVEVTEDEVEKIAAECDAKGRIMARAFVGELNKLAADANDESVSETSEPVSEETVQAEETNSAEEPAEKTAEDSAAHIVGSLYNNFFGEEE